MKKIAIIIFAAVVMASCGGSAVVQEARGTMNGSWTLTSITFPGNEENLEVTLLDNIPARCLENSQWSFISNNNTGSFETSGLNCDDGPNFFIWSINETNATTGNYDLMFKPTDEDFESTMGNAGYRIDLSNVSADQMVWEQTVQFEGEPFTIQMNFNKN